jgi:hypothetical protein
MVGFAGSKEVVWPVGELHIYHIATQELLDTISIHGIEVQILVDQVGQVEKEETTNALRPETQFLMQIVPATDRGDLELEALLIASAPGHRARARAAQVSGC